MFGAGLTTPPSPFQGPGPTAGLRPGSGLESLGLRSGKVRRPCHNSADFRGGAICLFRTHFLGGQAGFSTENIDPEQVRKLAGWGLTQNDRASFVGWSPQPSAEGPVPHQPGFFIVL